MYKDEFINFNNQKALIEDKCGRKEIRNYYDGIANTLAQENFVETLENKQKIVSDKLLESKKETTLKYLLKNIGVFCAVANTFWLVVAYILSLCNIFFFPFFETLLMILTDLAIILEGIENCRKAKRNTKRFKILKAYLNTKISEERDLLNDLSLEEENNQRICYSNDLSIEYLPDNKDKINEVNKICKDIDNNYMQYILFYKRGLLHRKLQKLGYSYEEIHAIFESIGEQVKNNYLKRNLQRKRIENRK